jgi:hypothetical protein
MFRKLIAASLLAAAAAAHAQSTDALVDKYTTLAGSKQNAQSLVDRLKRSQMGNGEVNIALSLTEAKLAQQNITRPTSAQLDAALEPILQSRADGKGWGEIANAMGVRLGDVMRSDRSRGNDRLARTEHTERERIERPEKPEKPERPERPERPEKPERPGR